ncbi:glycosyltransferase family 9 protein [Bacteroidota bacterium]
MKSDIERILVIQTAFLGDAILTLPMIQALKVKNNRQIVDVLSIPSTEEVFLSSPYVDNVIVMDKRKTHRGLLALNRFIQKLKCNNYTKIYSPHRSFRSAYMTLGLDVRESYGFNNSSLKFVYKYITDYNYQHHEVQRNLSLIGKETDSSGWKILPEISVSENQKARVNDLLAKTRLTDSFITIAPGSVWKTKRYPKESFIQIIKLLVTSGEKVLLIGGSDDKRLCDEIQSEVDSEIIVFAGNLVIPETVWLLKKSKLLITNDSAPTHLGMSADIPVITLYCSTVPDFGFYPYNNKSSVLSYDKLDCKPCGIHGYRDCPVKTFDCGHRLLPEDIINEAKRLIVNHG